MTTLTTSAGIRTGEITKAALTAMVGLALVLMAGLASPDALHAATHDTRHATGFPCH